MTKIRFGVIGCGYIASKAFIPAIKKSDHATLVACASRSHQKVVNFAEKFGCEASGGYNALLERDDIDVVYIATPTGCHSEISIKASNNGKNILCEKSLAGNIDQVMAITDACKRNNVAVFEGFMYQFHPQHHEIKLHIRQGKIGRPLVFQAWFGIPPLPKENFRYNKNLGGGALLDAGAYGVHAARHFFECEPLSVASIIEKNEYGIDIHGTVMLNFGDKRSALISFGFNNYYKNTYAVWGTKGQISTNRAFSVPPDFSPTITIDQQDNIEHHKIEPCDQFLKEIDYYSHAYSNENTRSIWRQEAVHQAEILEKIKKNAI